MFVRVTCCFSYAGQRIIRDTHSIPPTSILGGAVLACLMPSANFTCVPFSSSTMSFQSRYHFHALFRNLKTATATAPTPMWTSSCTASQVKCNDTHCTSYPFFYHHVHIHNLDEQARRKLKSIYRLLYRAPGCNTHEHTRTFAVRTPFTVTIVLPAPKRYAEKSLERDAHPCPYQQPLDAYRTRHVQFILRLHDSKADIINAFDIGKCQSRAPLCLL